MNVLPPNRIVADRHVQFSEFVAIDAQTQTSTQMATIVEPSIYAQRLERAMRTTATVDRRQPETEPSRPVKACKSALEKAALICGVLVIPSFAFAALGPLGLIAPVALAIASAVLSLMRGRPTQEILQQQVQRSNDARLYDSQV